MVKALVDDSGIHLWYSHGDQQAKANNLTPGVYRYREYLWIDNNEVSDYLKLTYFLL